MYAPNIIGQNTTKLASKLEKQRLSLLRQGKDFPCVDDLFRSRKQQREYKGDITHSYDIAACPGKVVVIPVRCPETASSQSNVKSSTGSPSLHKVDKIGLVCIGEINGQIQTHTVMPTDSEKGCLEEQLGALGFQGAIQPVTQVNKYKVVEIPGTKHLYGKVEELASRDTRIALVTADSKSFFGNLTGNVNEVFSTVDFLHARGEGMGPIIIKHTLNDWIKALQEQPRTKLAAVAKDNDMSR